MSEEFIKVTDTRMDGQTELLSELLVGAKKKNIYKSDINVVFC